MSYNYKHRAQQNTRVGNCDTCKFRGTCLLKWTEKQCIQEQTVVKYPYNPGEEERIKNGIAQKVKAIKKYKESKEYEFKRKAGR